MMSWRKIHRYVALVTLLPMAMIALTGIVLQLRNQFEAIQPSPVKSKLLPDMPFLTHERIIQEYGADKIEQIILRPGKGMMAVRLLDGNEVQLHPQTGEVLKKAPRRTNLLIELHQGSWMGPIGQYGIHFLTGIGLIFLIISGIVIYPFKRKRI